MQSREARLAEEYAFYLRLVDTGWKRHRAEFDAVEGEEEPGELDE